jgi:hypothetical protein
MAGPSIAVRVLGDLSGLASSFADAGSKVGAFTTKAHDAFSGMLGTLNKTGVLGPFGDALAGIDGAIGQIVEHGKSISGAMMGVGGALVGVGVGLQAVGSKDQAAHQQLQAAVQATGQDYDDYKDKIDKAVKSNEKYGDSADKTQDALRILTQATGDPAKALEYLGTATDLAAAKHEDLSTAAGQLGKTYNGATKLLKDFGVQAGEKSTAATKALATATTQATSADDAAAKAKQNLADLQARTLGKGPLTIAQQQQLRDAQQKVTDTTAKAQAAHQKLSAAQADVTKASHTQSDTMGALSTKLSGQASAAADTFGGHMSAIKAKVEDAAASIGQKYGGAITAAGAVMTGLGGAMKIAGGAVDALKDSQLLASAATKIMTAAQWLLNAAMDANPIMLVVLAIAAVIAIMILAYEKVGWFRDAVNDMGKAVVGAFNWLKQAALDVFHWIAANWPLLLGILLGPIALAAALIYQNWDTIKRGASAVVDWITGAWNGLYGFFSRIAGQIGGIFSGAWGAITGAFRNAINGVIDIWNAFASRTAIHISLPSIPGTSIGGGSIDTGQLVPGIGHLATGGIVTGPTLALIGEAGPEAVIPLNRGGLGPVVHIENATFSDQVDVDLFMRRVAWAAQTRSA